MGKGSSNPLARRFMQGAENVIDVTRVELRLPGCDLIGTPPMGFALEDPGPVVRGQLIELHALDCRTSRCQRPTVPAACCPIAGSC